MAKWQEKIDQMETPFDTFCQHCLEPGEGSDEAKEMFLEKLETFTRMLTLLQAGVKGSNDHLLALRFLRSK